MLEMLNTLIAWGEDLDRSCWGKFNPVSPALLPSWRVCAVGHGSQLPKHATVRCLFQPGFLGLNVFDDYLSSSPAHCNKNASESTIVKSETTF